jgi:hypothetical protein
MSPAASPAPQGLVVFVGGDGRLKFVYDDELLPLMELGSATMRRASHVEPLVGLRGETRGEWLADLTPYGGPVLTDFGTRAEALAAERDWLNAQLGGCLQQEIATQ